MPVWEWILIAAAVVIVIAVVALVLPGVIETTPTSTPDARLQLWGGNGPGWYCYARTFDGSEVMLRSLGMIPGLTYRPSGTPA